MCSEKLNLHFLWLPNSEEIDDVVRTVETAGEDNFQASEAIKKLKLNLRSFLGEHIFIQTCKRNVKQDSDNDDEGRKKLQKSVFLTQFLFTVHCTAVMENNFREGYKKIVNKFFSSKHDKLKSQLYLQYDSKISENISIETELHTHDLKKFSLGNIIGLNTFAEHFNSETSLDSDGYKIKQLKLQIVHDYRKLILYFAVAKICAKNKRSSLTHRFHKMEIPYCLIHSFIICSSENTAIYMRLYKVPLLYRIVQDEDEDENYLSFKNIGPKTQWYRTVDLFNKNPEYIRKEFSMNNTLRLEINGNDYDFITNILPHCQSISLFFAPIYVINNSKKHISQKLNIKNFDCLYALSCVLSHNFETVDQLIYRNEFNAVISFINEKSEENADALCDSMFLIFDAITKCHSVPFFHCLRFLYSKFKNNSSGSTRKTAEKNDLLLINRILLLPTHIKLLPPQPSLRNRALRDCDSKFSLRVSIRDVNMNTLNFTLLQGPRNNTQQIVENFYNVFFKERLLKGLGIGKRLYEYVGSSTSQLKGHGLWFYAKDRDKKTANILRKQFGELEKIKQVSKYMARMGQSFSQSMGCIPVSQDLTNVDDPDDDVEGVQKKYLLLDSNSKIKSTQYESVFESENENKQDTEESKENGVENDEEEKDPYIFSDGVGRISNQLAEKIYKKFEIMLEEKKPSAMQIRYAGCKGMLLVDPNLEGESIRFRKSMKKFNSSHTSLEILKFSEKRAAELNRPFITILEQLKVPKASLISLQKDMIQSTITSMFHEYDACQFLHRNSLLRLDYRGMYAMEMHFTEDPLFRTMIFALFKKNIDLLKNKANIQIPADKGRVMFGVMDETGTLEYGQVFVQYTEWESDKTKILTGQLVVTKNPCMHPGDVRTFEAVEVDALRHVVDCIVFPSKGPRPHPDEMAGSDLDGDEYHVIWMEELLPGRQSEPMHFAQPKDKKVSKKSIEPSDELDHLGRFIFEDTVGLVASAHLATADYIRQGIFSKMCIELAKEYSVSLDFAKSGKSIKPSYRPKKYPDFMQKQDEKQTYLSRNALGSLFRNCKQLESGLEIQITEIDFNADVDLVEDLSANYFESAKKTLKEYSSTISNLMKTYGFENEGQLLAGAIINPPSYYENRHDLMNLVALLEYEIQRIFKDLSNEFFKEFGGKPKNDQYTEKMFQKASAWYIITYDKSDNQLGFYGLPWAISDVLIELKFKNKKHKKSRKSNAKSLLEEKIDQKILSPSEELTSDMDSKIIRKKITGVLNTACTVLENWIKSHKDFFMTLDIRDIIHFKDEVFNNSTSDMLNCDSTYIHQLKQEGEIKRAISPGYLVIKTLLLIANMTSEADLLRQQLGLLSWITLVKLSCSHNLQYLGIYDESVSSCMAPYKPQDDIIDTFQFLLFDKYSEMNDRLSQCLIKSEPKFLQVLESLTKLKKICFRHMKDKNESWARFTVQGTRFAIERFKDILINEKYYDKILKIVNNQ